MHKPRTRPSSLPGVRAGILALLLLALLPLLAAAPASAPAPAAPGPEGAALALLPSSAALVIWADYSALRRSDLVAGMEARIDSLPEAAEHYRDFVRETGLDPRQDTDQILLSVSSLDRSAGDGFLVVARGRFASSRLPESAAAKGGSLTTTSRGIRVWSSREKGGPGEARTQGETNIALARIGDGILLFGSEDEVLRAAGVASGADSPAVRDPRLKDLLAGVQHRAPFWAVLNSRGLAERISSEMAGGNGELNPGSALSAVESVRLMGWLGKDLDLRVVAEAKDRESAGLLGDLCRGLVAGAKLSARESDPELLGILQETNIVENGREVEIKTRIPGSRLRPPAAPSPEP